MSKPQDSRDNLSTMQGTKGHYKSSLPRLWTFTRISIQMEYETLFSSQTSIFIILHFLYRNERSTMHMRTLRRSLHPEMLLPKSSPLWNTRNSLWVVLWQRNLLIWMYFAENVLASRIEQARAPSSESIRIIQCSRCEFSIVLFLFSINEQLPQNGFCVLSWGW